MYQSEEVGMFYTYVLSYMILYMPTLALVNSVSFNQMKIEKEFANNVRTIGLDYCRIVYQLYFSLGYCRASSQVA
jgi:hypothetical protein